jgi:hypothetical protein
MNISRLPQLINQSHKNKSSYAVLHQKKTAPFLANVNIQRPSNYYAITICKILYVTMHNVIKYTGFVFRTYLLTYARNKKKSLQMTHSVTLYTNCTKAFVLSDCCTASRFMCKRDFIYGHKNSTAFLMPNVRKLTNALKHYV